MYVASLKVSKELYELSGWDDTELWLHVKGNGDTKLFDPIAPHLMDCDAPAYDLGYLLRKLPKEVTYGNRGAYWYADYGQYGNGQADTPEDCAAKLCVELFKQGILKKEVSND